MQSIRLTTATDVVASIPALLGFVPVFSIVTLLLTESVVDDHTETRILLVARADADDRGIDRHSGTLAAIAHRESVTGAITVVIVDGSPVVIDEAISNALAVREHLAHHNIPTVRMLHTANIEEGATWTDLDTLEMGVTVDHRFSDVSVAAVLYGRNVASSAAALYARYGLAAEADMRAAHTTSIEQGDDFVRATLAELLEVVRTGDQPSADLAGRVGMVATLGGERRDAIIAAGRHGLEDATAATVHISRHLRGVARAHMLTIAGLFAYMAGHGVEARIACERADSAAGGHELGMKLLRLLEHSIRHGLNPVHLSELIDIGVAKAQELGVDID
ncbi:DUF4192 domain-containing protein [Rhodococcus sp. NPDC019627]|uniref:DUF4192 domain-containing protein n=1 Tax=unclassified Rhodococcus (in: high G+C Gram-positive bacteria) TaxID=192944 RepID=UPI003401E3BE